MRTQIMAGWCVAAAVILAIGGTITELTFGRVGYPGAGFGGVPLTFDLQQKQDNLAALEQHGTLDLFAAVQVIDFSIVVGTLLFFVFLTLLASRPYPAQSRLRKAGRYTVVAFVTASAMDASENLSALILIATRHQHLAWLSYLNSGFTLGKVALFIAGWCGLAVLLGAALVHAFRRR